MRVILVLSVLFFAGATLALPVVENARWQLVPNAEGQMHMVDTNAVEDVETFFEAGDVTFTLFTQRNPTAGQLLQRSAASIQASQWNIGSGVRFTIHGWGGNGAGGMNPTLRNQYLAHGNHNVVAVDWSAANSPNYVTSRNRVAEAGLAIGTFVQFLHANGFITSFAQVVMAGHSLGAHVAGHAGKVLGPGNCGAIYGLDPAGPLFFFGTPATRLAITDCVYTEMIGTNIGALGFDQPICHGNFYPNWGGDQPGCGTDGGCAHGIVVPFMAESINSPRFVGIRCSGWPAIQSRSCPPGQGTEIMGGPGTKSISGVFFLTTNAASPHAQG